MYICCRSKVLSAFFFTVVIVLDQATKMWAFSAFTSGPSVGGVSPFVLFDHGIRISLALATNTGAAWSLFADHPMLLSLVRIVLVFFLASYLFSSKCRTRHRLPLSLILAGATSNLCEMLLYGYVTDMLSVNFWGWQYPIFNIADTSIFCGAALMVWMSIFGDVYADPRKN